MEKNNLVITNVDIKQVEPIDSQTKASLQKTVQLAIEISTKKQEAAATHLAEQSEQKALGEIEELKINAQLQAEEVQQRYYQLLANSKKVLTSGKAQAAEEANAKAQQIEAEANLDQAKYRSQARKIENEAKLDMEM